MSDNDYRDEIARLTAERDTLFNDFTKHTVEAAQRLAAAEVSRNEAKREVELERESHVVCSARLAAAEAELDESNQRIVELDGSLLLAQTRLAAAELVVEAARKDRDEHERAVAADEEECIEPCPFSRIDAALARSEKAYFSDRKPE